MSTFALDIAAWVNATKGSLDDTVGLVLVNIAAELDKRSPVGDATYWKNPPPAGYVGGHFRANWQLGVGSFPIGEIPGADPTGAGAQARIAAAIPDQAAGKVYWIANNVPYAQRLEYGWSRQAPQGVVGVTTAMFQQIAAKSIAEARK